MKNKVFQLIWIINQKWQYVNFSEIDDQSSQYCTCNKNGIKNIKYRNIIISIPMHLNFKSYVHSMCQFWCIFSSQNSRGKIKATSSTAATIASSPITSTIDIKQKCKCHLVSNLLKGMLFLDDVLLQLRLRSCHEGSSNLLLTEVENVSLKSTRSSWTCI